MRAAAVPRAGRLAGLTLVALFACDSSVAVEPAVEPEPTPASWPEGTVVVVDGLAASAREIDELADEVGELYPEFERPHRRRLVLTNVTFPRAAVRAAFPEAREAARAACEEARPAVLAGELEGDTTTGFLWDTDLALWSAVRGRTPGVWSEPVELVGRWALLRLDEHVPGATPQDDRFTVHRVEFPYLPGPDRDSAVQAALDGSTLTIVDPAWEEVVPEAWKHRMRGDAR